MQVLLHVYSFFSQGLVLFYLFLLYPSRNILCKYNKNILSSLHIVTLQYAVLLICLVFVYVYINMCVCSHMDRRRASALPHCYSLEPETAHWTWNLPFWLDWQPASSSFLLSPTPPHWGQRHLQLCLALSCVFWVSSLGPDAWGADSLTWSHQPSPLISFLISFQ